MTSRRNLLSIACRHSLVVIGIGLIERPIARSAAVEHVSIGMVEGESADGANAQKILACKYAEYSPTNKAIGSNAFRYLPPLAEASAA